MYTGKVSCSILPTKSNLKNVILETTNSTSHLIRHSFSFRQLSLLESCRNVHELKNQLLVLIENGQILKAFRRNLLSISESLKNQSSSILRVWTHQCECVVAQRLRRGQQMFCLYSKIWEERALKEFLNRMRQQVTRRGSELVLSAVGVAAYNWDANRIAEDEIKEHIQELEYMHVLKDNTMICQVCRNSNRNNDAGRMTLHCNCTNRKSVYLPYDEWSVFIEKKDMLVWRRLHESGSYEYKVYGSFNDVYADDFLNVQIDIEYRTQWDTTAVTLNIVEKDPNPSSNSDIVYWEMLWPRLFANRDYVFKRRYMVDKPSKTLLLVSKCTEHPCCPVSSDKYRVNDYSSYMVIKPYTSFTKPGLEFGLTYFDNPGVNIPAAVTAWVAYRAMPEFLNKLRCAAREYHEYCLKNGCSKLCCLKNLGREEEEDGVALDQEEEASVFSKVAKNIVVHSFRRHEPGRGAKESIKKGPAREMPPEKTPGADVMTSPSPMVQAEVGKQNYWKYLQPTYYFS